MKTDYKQFQLNNVNDYAYYVEYLIIQYTKKMRRFERYMAEIELFLNDKVEFESIKTCLESHNDLNSPPSVNFNMTCSTISCEKYDSFMDMTTASGLGILNLLADTQSSSVSYQNFRNLVKRKKLIKHIPALEVEYVKLLENCRDFRNWSAHIPQSLINAELISIERVIPGARAQLLKTKSKILVPIYIEKATEHLVKLYVDCYMSLKLFKKLYLRIVKDYKFLSNKEEVTVDYALSPLQPYEVESLQDISYSMQQRKFKE